MDSKIKLNFKATQYRKIIYLNKGRTPSELKVREHVLLKVKPKKSYLKLGSCTSLASNYCGPFVIIDKIGLVSHMIVLHASLNAHNVFHVSLLKNYIHDIHDPNHVINMTLI